MKQTIGLGFEEFMDNASEGWSLVAVQASADQTAQALRRRVDVLDYRAYVEPMPLEGHPILHREPHKRLVFLVKLEGNPWTFLLRTVDWIRPEDAVGARRMASELSRELHTVTVSSVGAYDGAECRVFERGEELQRVDTDDPSLDFLTFCEQQALSLPGCFIGCDERDPLGTLYIQDLPLTFIERADRFLLRLR